ncbi:MAG: hypothetical protein ACLQK8_30330 [Streptosporangiaceae bacterium]|jgi:hypothetical protein
MPTGDDDNDRELEQLRAEVGQLRTRVADAEARARAAHQDAQAARATTAKLKTAPPRPRRHLNWRTPVASVLIVLGCLLAPVSVLAVWTSNQVSNTDRYVANVSPLIHEPAVQAALTSRISTAISNEVNVRAYVNLAAGQLTKRGLPRLGALISGFSGSIASGVNGFIHSIVAKIVSSPAIARLWVQVNRRAHTQLVKALSGQPHSAIVISGNEVVLSLGPLIDQAKHNLAARGLTVVNKLPPINPTFPLFDAKYLIKAQSAYRLLNTLRWVLPILAVILIAAGIYITHSHRRALIGAALGVAAGMLLLAIGLAIGRTIYLNQVPASVLPSDAAAVVFDTLVRFIKQGLHVILAVALIVALAAFFSGPSTTAVRSRNAVKTAFGKVRGTGERFGVNTGPVGPWVYQHRTLMRIAAVVIAALVLAFTSYPTALVVLVIALALLAVLGLIELIARPPAPPPAEPPGVIPPQQAPDHQPTAAPAAGATVPPPPGR